MQCHSEKIALHVPVCCELLDYKIEFARVLSILWYGPHVGESPPVDPQYGGVLDYHVQQVCLYLQFDKTVMG